MPIRQRHCLFPGKIRKTQQGAAFLVIPAQESRMESHFDSLAMTTGNDFIQPGIIPGPFIPFGLPGHEEMIRGDKSFSDTPGPVITKPVGRAPQGFAYIDILDRPDPVDGKSREDSREGFGKMTQFVNMAMTVNV